MEIFNTNCVAGRRSVSCGRPISGRQTSQFSQQEGQVVDNVTLFSSGLSLNQINAYFLTCDKTAGNSASTDVHFEMPLPGQCEVGSPDLAKKTIPPARLQEQLPRDPEREATHAGIDATQQSNARFVDHAMPPLNSNEGNASGVLGRQYKAELTPFKPHAEVPWCSKMKAEEKEVPWCLEMKDDETSAGASRSSAEEPRTNDVNAPTANDGSLPTAAELLLRGLANGSFCKTSIQADTGVVPRRHKSFKFPTDVRMTGRAIVSTSAQSDMNLGSWVNDSTAVYCPELNLAKGSVCSAAAEPFMNDAEDGLYVDVSIRRKWPKVAKSYSRKVFVGGLPPDMRADMIEDQFRNYGPLSVSWPHRDERNNILYPPEGFVFLKFQEKESVRRLMVGCEYILGGGYYTLLRSPSITKPVQVRAWASADADCMIDQDGVHPRNTVFVGGVPRPLTASQLAEAMKIFGAVCYAGIDLDSEFGYPKGSARVVFRGKGSCIAAICCRFLDINADDLMKRVELKAYVLMDQPCDMCQGVHNGNQVAKYYCAHVACLMYLCSYCWVVRHRTPALMFHKPQIQKLSIDELMTRPNRRD